jgi:(p)ppGpp synthase/HD superfamily hydrolase
MNCQARCERITEMPLHQLTAIHGEPGLRLRFAHEAARLGSDDDCAKAERALTLATDLHRNDRRQDEPYINHPLRVALRIICHYDVLDTDVICAALLHDTVEDHVDRLSTNGRQGALHVLAEQFGQRVAGLVSAVTNPIYDPSRDKHTQYSEHVVTSLTPCPWARVIKVSDFTDNAVGLHYTTGAKVTRLAHKYAPLVSILQDLIDRPDTPLAADVKDHIRDQLHRAADRCAQTERR